MSNIVKIIKDSNSDTCLIFFPYVGASWTAFIPIAKRLKGDLSIISINPPGHNGDTNKLLDNINDMADLYYKELIPFLKPNLILCGYSLGCLVIHSLLNKLNKSSYNHISVIIAASTPPHHIKTSEKISSKSNNEVINFFYSIGGIHEVLLKEKELLEMFLPVLKADYKAFETYQTNITKTDYPCFLIYGKEDNFVNRDNFLEWDKYFTSPPITYFINGNHLLIRDNPIEFSDVLQEILFIIESNLLDLKKQLLQITNQ